MYKKILLSLAFTGLLAGCATLLSPQSSDSPEPMSDNGGVTEFSDQKAPAPMDEEKPAEAKAPVTAAPAPTSGDSQNLNDAIKSGNDEAIYRASIIILSKNPSDAKGLNALGMYHYRKGHYPAAEMMFNKGLKANPTVSELHNNLALTLLAEKEDREAIKEFRKALALNNDDGIAAANLGSIYIQQQDYIKALVGLEIAYRKNSKDQKVLNNYAIALTANGKYPEAKEIYQKAMQLNSNNKDVMLNYAILLIDDLKQNQEGLDLLNKVKFLGPSPESKNRINVLENKAKAGVK